MIRVTYLEEYMWETCAEIRPIYIELLLSGQVHINAARAVDFDTRRGEFFGDANGKDDLSLAEDAGARPERPADILLTHLVQPVGRQDVPRVNDAVKVHGRLVDLQELRVVEVI